MTTNLSSPQKYPREEKHNLFTEASNKEKQLVVLIHTKGLLNTEVQELYRKVRSSYEKIILNDDDKQSELQDIEYCLWKLHYKHIDEFRKRIKKPEAGDRHDANHLDKFKLFLSDATEFYRNLITNVRECYRLPNEASFSRNGYISRTSTSKRLQMGQFLCHRFLVCLGDLARYREQYEKLDARNHSWSMAATHYMEATAIWPDSGNPQNQLAVLATYVGDEFLALYHCIRSLAVKEPFPDAHDNLIVLLERNRSSFSPSRSSEIRFNFSNPSERCVAVADSTGFSVETDVWSLFIKLISFFFIKSSFDDFPFAFSLLMRELDVLMALDDEELKASLESYRNLDSVKTGPFRALQLVSILLYTLQNSVNTRKPKGLEDTTGVHRKWALLCTFVFMGRFVDRCLTASSVNSCPLLPSVLVFVEWFANTVNEADEYWADEQCRISMSYFFGSFFDLLKRIGFGKSSGHSSDRNPLWEDYELRGFAPVASSHESLDFSSRSETDGFKDGTESRLRRVITAGRAIHENSRGRFFNPSAETDPSNQNPKTDGNGLSPEDEEVILFDPLTRHNSAPVRAGPAVPPDDYLRHATSLLTAQNRAQGSDPLADGPRKSLKPPEHQVSAGPPSLSAWVIKPKPVFGPTHEAASESLHRLSIEAGPGSASPYAAPAPSAPLLPDDAAWYAALQPGFRAGKPAAGEGIYTYATGPVHPGHRQMSSSEWLRHYLQTHQSPGWPVAVAVPGFYYSGPGEPSPVTVQVESPALYTALPLDYGGAARQRPGLYGCGGAATETEPQPLLQYLKERERQLHHDPLFRGPSYMGN